MGLGLFLCLFASLVVSQEVIDRIVAVVNGEVIAQSDLEIVEAFGLYKSERESEDSTQSSLLSRLIAQKLVLQLTSEDIKVEAGEIEALRNHILSEEGPDAADKLSRFGLGWEDLDIYLREKIMYEKVIALKFGQAVSVSLEDIQEYYREIYVSQQLSKGLPVDPLTDRLGEIEAAIRKRKAEARVREWVENLRQKADILIIKE